MVVKSYRALVLNCKCDTGCWRKSQIRFAFFMTCFSLDTFTSKNYLAGVTYSPSHEFAKYLKFYCFRTDFVVTQLSTDLSMVVGG